MTLETRSVETADGSNADRGAVLNSLWLRAWQGASVLITIPLVLRYLDAENQGLYYLFLSVASTQSFFEMGLGLITTIRASHEWIGLRVAVDGSVQGPQRMRAKLTKICRISLTFTSAAALVFLTVAIIAGTRFMDAGAVSHGDHVTVFFIYIALMSCVMVLSSMIAVVEGCNQVGAAAIFRLIQSVVGAITLWLALLQGCGIQSLVFQATSSLICSAIYIFLWRRRFFASVYLSEPDDVLSWKTDFFPHQWRLATQSIFNLLAFPFFQFLSFTALGPVESGKLGLTLQIALGVQGLSLVFISAKVPHLSMLAARGDRDLVRREWRRQLAKSVVFMLVCFSACLLALGMIARGYESYYLRVLGIRETALLFGGLLATAYIYGVASIVRAHKMERFTVVGVFAGVAYSSAAVALCGSMGNLGIALAYALVTLLFVLPASRYVMKAFEAEHLRA